MKIKNKHISSIFKTAIYYGRQAIEFRGHRENKPLLNNEHETSTRTNHSQKNVNNGHFRELLRFRVDDSDKKLEDHLISNL